MKRSLRPLFTILLLIFFAGILTFRLPLHRLGYLNLVYDIPPTRAPKKPVFNETLLRLAATDLAEPNLKQEIESLLEGNPGNRGRRRSFLSSGKYHVHVRSRSPELPEFRRLWQSFRRHLSDWSRNRRFFYSDVMPELVSSVKVSLDEFNGGKGVTEKFKTCAVVGNSGILLKTDYGGIIDGHESVIRLNNARIRGYERKVGAKTNISFVNSNILHSCARRSGCFCHPYGVNIAMIMYICQPAHFFDYLVCNSSHKAPLIVTDPRFDMLCSTIVKYYSLKRFVEVKGKDPAEWASFHDGSNFHYSSGMQAVMLAVVMCEKVSVFGFGKSELARHHYHTNQRGELSLHDYEAEYDLYRDLEGGVMIPFVSGSFKFPPFVMYH